MSGRDERDEYFDGWNSARRFQAEQEASRLLVLLRGYGDTEIWLGVLTGLLVTLHDGPTDSLSTDDRVRLLERVVFEARNLLDEMTGERYRG